MASYIGKHACDGCGSQDKKVESHRSRFGSGKHSCSDSDTNHRDKYPLHAYCQECGYDWVTDTAVQAEEVPA